MHPSAVDESRQAGPSDTAGPPSAFDALHRAHAPGLVRQAHLLTGRPDLACRAVRHAFELAWQRWPQVAVDPDPAGWVRAAAHEYALSPWHRLRPRLPRPAPDGDAAPDPLLDALLCLPPVYRRALLLHDGLGLDVTEVAREVEASTEAATNRVANARAAMADRLPELHEAPERLPALLAERLDDPATGGPLRPTAPEAVREASERKARSWTVLGSLAVATAVTAFVAMAAPGGHDPAGGSRPQATAAARPTAPLPVPAPDRAGAARGEPAARAEQAARADDGKGAQASSKGARAEGRGSATGASGQSAGKRNRPPQAVDGRPGTARLAPEPR